METPSGNMNTQPENTKKEAPKDVESTLDSETSIDSDEENVGEIESDEEQSDSVFEEVPTFSEPQNYDDIPNQYADAFKEADKKNEGSGASANSADKISEQTEREMPETSAEPAPTPEEPQSVEDMPANTADEVYKKQTAKQKLEENPTPAESTEEEQNPISSEEYGRFEQAGEVSDERLESIAKKIMEQGYLSDQERAIHGDKTGEIEEIIQKKAGAAKKEDPYREPITKDDRVMETEPIIEAIKKDSEGEAPQESPPENEEETPDEPSSITEVLGSKVLEEPAVEQVEKGSKENLTETEESQQKADEDLNRLEKQGVPDKLATEANKWREKRDADDPYKIDTSGGNGSNEAEQKDAAQGDTYINIGGNVENVQTMTGKHIEGDNVIKETPPESQQVEKTPHIPKKEKTTTKPEPPKKTLEEKSEPDEEKPKDSASEENKYKPETPYKNIDTTTNVNLDTGIEAEKDSILQTVEALEKMEGTNVYESFGVSPEDLASVPGFNDLSEGQRLMVAENLKQLTLGRVHNEAKDTYKEQNANTKFLGKIANLVTKGTKGWRIAKLERANTRDLKEGGLAMHGESLNKLVELAEKGPGVEVLPDGSTQIEYVPKMKNLTTEQMEKVIEFNKAANAFGKIPDAWSRDEARGVDKHDYNTAKAEYEAKKLEIIGLELETTEGNEESAMDLVASVDQQVQMDRFMNTNPDVERQLQKIEDKTLLKHMGSSLLKGPQVYAVGGYLTRWGSASLLTSVGAGIASFAAAPAIASGIGALRARGSAKETIAERDEDASRGITDSSEEAKNFIDAEKLTSHLDRDMQKIENTDDSDTKQKLASSLLTRIRYTQEKIEDGNVAYGDGVDKISNQYELMRALSFAKVAEEGVSNVEDNEELNERLDKVLNLKDEKIDEARKEYIKKQTIRGAKMAAGFAIAGSTIRFAQETGLFGGGGDSAEAVATASAPSETIPPSGVPNEEVIAPTNAVEEAATSPTEEEQISKLQGEAPIESEGDVFMTHEEKNAFFGEQIVEHEKEFDDLMEKISKATGEKPPGDDSPLREKWVKSQALHDLMWRTREAFLAEAGGDITNFHLKEVGGVYILDGEPVPQDISDKYFEVGDPLSPTEISAGSSPDMVDPDDFADSTDQLEQNNGDQIERDEFLTYEEKNDYLSIRRKMYFENSKIQNPAARINLANSLAQRDLNSLMQRGFVGEMSDLGEAEAAPIPETSTDAVEEAAPEAPTEVTEEATAGAIPDTSAEVTSTPEATAETVERAPTATTETTPEAIEAATVITPEGAATESLKFTHEVKSGDNLWNILKEQLSDRAYTNDMTEVETTHMIDAVKDKFAAMSEDELKAIGIGSGNVDKLGVGETIDLKDVFENTEFMKDSLERTNTLSEEARASIAENIGVSPEVQEVVTENIPPLEMFSESDSATEVTDTIDIPKGVSSMEQAKAGTGKVLNLAQKLGIFENKAQKFDVAYLDGVPKSINGIEVQPELLSAEDQATLENAIKTGTKEVHAELNAGPVFHQEVNLTPESHKTLFATYLEANTIAEKQKWVQDRTQEIIEKEGGSQELAATNAYNEASQFEKAIQAGQNLNEPLVETPNYQGEVVDGALTERALTEAEQRTLRAQYSEELSEDLNRIFNPTPEENRALRAENRQAARFQKNLVKGGQSFLSKDLNRGINKLGILKHLGPDANQGVNISRISEWEGIPSQKIPGLRDTKVSEILNEKFIQGGKDSIADQNRADLYDYLARLMRFTSPLEDEVAEDFILRAKAVRDSVSV